MKNIIDDIRKVVPDFEFAKCHWIRRAEVVTVASPAAYRIVLDYGGCLDVALVVVGIHEMPTFKPATTPWVLPYAPYDLGELLLTVDPRTDCIVLFDELNGWRLVADSLVFEGSVDHIEDVE